MKRRIFIVDDHPIMRWGYKALIDREADLEMCGEAGSAMEALEKIAEDAPDLVIADISLEGMNGIELTKRLQMLLPDVPVMIVSMHDESLYAERALRAGARAYIMKNEVHGVVVAAIRRVLGGKFFLSDQMSSKILFQYLGHPPEEEASPVDRLSDRELEVFELIGRGYSTREIAEALLISPKTVESHRGRIKNKLVLENTAQLVQRAVQWVQSEGLA